MRAIIEARVVECHTNTRENFLFTKCIVIFAHETLIINAYFIKSFSQCNEAHRRKWTIFEKTKFLKFGRDWPKVAGVAGVAGTGCGIVSLDNLTPFHKKIIFDWRFSKILFWKKTLPFFLRQHGSDDINALSKKSSHSCLFKIYTKISFTCLLLISFKQRNLLLAYHFHNGILIFDVMKQKMALFKN